MSRAGVRSDLQAQLSAALTSSGVDVFLGAANNDVPNEGVWFWDVENVEIEYPILAGPGSAVRDDIYRFEIRVVAGKPGQTDAEAEARVNDLVDAVESSIVDDRHISDDDAAVISILPIALRGPVTGPTTEGVISAMYLTVEIHERKGPS